MLGLLRPSPNDRGAAPVAENFAPQTSSHKSPSYPLRVHIRERAKWREVLDSCESRVAKARAELDTLPAARRDDARRLLAQMMGARDQVADAARRMPMEVGDLYEEDHHRLDDAVQALERVMKRWEELKKG
jgi:hypothetical protein